MSENTTATFAEAPASFNVRMQSPDGFECQLTLRGTSGADLLPRVAQALEWAKAKGYRPIVNGYVRGYALTDEKGKQYKMCETHQARMYAKTDQGGRTWYSHKLDDGTWCKGK